MVLRVVMEEPQFLCSIWGELVHHGVSMSHERYATRCLLGDRGVPIASTDEVKG
ncbi:hypothetical protein Lalb_Chr18g0052651 [Lupinus albus]|uniref:Uncharacterized protein n=1 Tax=Lupinus albus TaxID=3870 RepID=A0A6A4P5G6_LUPAL|nr:hypothetical protein Lalb_Chr18g0052651 [Lupinus albus]